MNFTTWVRFYWEKALVIGASVFAIYSNAYPNMINSTSVIILFLKLWPFDRNTPYGSSEFFNTYQNVRLQMQNFN